MATLAADTIIDEAEAQEILGWSDERARVYLLNALAAKARAWMNRVQLRQDLDTPITETFRGPAMQTLWLHAPVYVADFAAHDLTVDLYVGGALNTTYSANAGHVVVTSDDFASRVDMVSGDFLEVSGADFLRVTYYGGWETVPGDVMAGAIEQARIDLKRWMGQVGMLKKAKGGESVEYETHGVLRSVADAWRPYRILV